MERLRKAASTLVYLCAKQHSEPLSDRRTDQRGARADELALTPLELINPISGSRLTTFPKALAAAAEIVEISNF
jgi:hypothetical protein